MVTGSYGREWHGMGRELTQRGSIYEDWVPGNTPEKGEGTEWEREETQFSWEKMHLLRDTVKS